MDKAERLALAVKAQVASIRADQARERSALLERRYAPVTKAFEAYEQLYGGGTDPADHFDVLLSLIVQYGGGELGREELLEGMSMHEEQGAASRGAADAMRELAEAMGGHRGTVLEWVGCTREEFVSVLESRLNT